MWLREKADQVRALFQTRDVTFRVNGNLIYSGRMQGDRTWRPWIKWDRHDHHDLHTRCRRTAHRPDLCSGSEAVALLGRGRAGSDVAGFRRLLVGRLQVNPGPPRRDAHGNFRHVGGAIGRELDVSAGSGKLLGADGYLFSCDGLPEWLPRSSRCEVAGLPAAHPDSFPPRRNPRPHRPPPRYFSRRRRIV
jgi:hypothetical protein